MILRQLYDDASSTYTYLLADHREAVLIDSVFEQHTRDAALIRELGLTLVATLDTHVHADHVTGAWLMKQTFGSRIGLSARGNAKNVDDALSDAEIVRFGERELRVRETPGHTDSCLTFVLDDETMAFTGDCLLIRGAGRTDFQQGDARTLFRSIHDVLFALPDACFLYPAHDYSGRTVTTVSEEREHNARVGGNANEVDFVGYMDNLGLPHPKQIDIAVPANLRSGRPENASMPPQPSWGPVKINYAGIPEIGARWVATHIREVLVLDVREARELDDSELGRIEGATNIPLGQLRERVGEVPRDRPLVAVCRSGKRSAQAALILRGAGYDRVANLSGGMIEWGAQSLPVAKS